MTSSAGSTPMKNRARQPRKLHSEQVLGRARRNHQQGHRRADDIAYGGEGLKGTQGKRA
jgi:hypothetical protein